MLPTPWDVIQIVKHTGKRPRDFLEFLDPDEITEVDEDDPTWLEVGDERYIMALWRDEKEGCLFLDNTTRRCTIYEARPILCRLYPFKLEEDKNGNFKGFSLHKDVECPRNRGGAYDTQPLHSLYIEDSQHQEDYEDLVKVFNRRQYEGKAPEDFIALFYEERPA